MHLKRFLVMVFLLLGGVGSLLYGSLFHGAMIEEEKEREISIAVPTMPEFGNMPLEPPGGGPMATPPGMRFETVTEKYVESSEELEPTIVWEVTFGGLVRMANGQLKRTYSGKPPALCPT